MAFSDYPWKSKALNIFAPHPDEVDRFCAFVEKELVPDGIDTIVMIVRYNYAFVSHPECRGDYPLSKADCRRMVEICRKHGIRLVPNMNLFSHQTVHDCKEADGLLRAHPEFSETPLSEELEHSYSICPNAPGLYEIVIDLMDELIDAFQPEWFHMGGDEVFYIGQCDRCKGHDTGELYANWYNRLAAHLKEKGITPMLWGDRLLNSTESGYDPWEASSNGTDTAIRILDRSIIITDWHYHNWPRFRSVDIFAKAGFKMYLCPFYIAENAKLFLDYAKEHDDGHILGVMETTWTPVKFFMDGMEGKELEEEKWYKETMPQIVRCYDWLFRPEKFAKLLPLGETGESLQTETARNQ